MSDMDQTVLRTSRSKTRARIDGETIEISTAEAVLSMTVRAAMKGNSHAQYLHLTYTAITEANERTCRALDIENALRLAAHNTAIMRRVMAICVEASRTAVPTQGERPEGYIGHALEHMAGRLSTVLALEHRKTAVRPPA